VPSHEDRRERRFFASVLVTAALVVVAALALAFVLGAHPRREPHPFSRCSVRQRGDPASR
jgi:hypothetical protein